MESQEVEDYFGRLVNEDPEQSAAISAIQTLLEFMKRDSSATLQGLREGMKKAIEQMKLMDASVTSVSSGCELFVRFITLAGNQLLENPNFQECKSALMKRGKVFLGKAATSRSKIAKLCHPFIRDGSIILTHSYSRVVLHALLEAAKSNKRFKVYVTESHPDRSGYKMKTKLDEQDIPCVVILDLAVGYIMEKVDLVLVGAEGVVESGGIINKIGSHQMAICAREINKPFYVLAESFKFTRLFPLSQQEIPLEFKYPANLIKSRANLEEAHPLVDYTPPIHITLLFTDLGILTPSAVSDELLNLYM